MKIEAGGVAFDDVAAIVFDKDGTLIDLDSYWLAAAWVWVKVAGAGDRDLEHLLATRLGIEERRITPGGMLAMGTVSAVVQETASILRLHGVGSPDAKQRAVCARHEAEQRAAKSRPAPMGDVAGTLRRLSGAGISLAVVTSDDAEPTARIFRDLGIDDLLAKVICADDGLTPKPDPACLVAVADHLGCHPASLLMVGDSAVDADAAYAAGAAGFVLVSPPGRPPSVASDSEVASVEEIRAVPA